MALSVLATTSVPCSEIARLRSRDVATLRSSRKVTQGSARRVPACRTSDRRLRHVCWAIAAAEPASEQKSTGQGPQTQASPANTQESFTWLDHWYPVGLVQDLDASKPNPVKMFGKSLVVWRDTDHQWKCFADSCPHRLAPLSEGRIDPEGNLQCAYHGWSFDSKGGCTGVPQAHNPEQSHKAAAHPRACATVYPTQVQHSLVWVWPNAGPNAHLKAMSKPAPVMPELLDEQNLLHVSPWFMRDLPYGHDVLLENLLDPAHVPWAHHGVQGDRFNQPNSALGQPEPLQDAHGFSTPFIQDTSKQVRDGTSMQAMSASADADIVFKAPNLLNYKYHGKTGIQIISYSTPTTPGKCRLFFKLIMDRRTAPEKLIRALDIKHTLQWLNFADHYERNLVLDGDNCFLHLQDCARNLGDEESPYYMPTSMDRAVAAFRHWMQHTAGPIPFSMPTSAEYWSQDISKEQLLDRYNQHTKHCKNCSKALQVFTWMQRGAMGCIAVSALASAAAVGAGQGSPTTWAGILAGGLLSATAVWRIQIERQKFLFMDYVHAEK